MSCEPVIWCLLLVAREMIHVFIGRVKVCNNYAENVRRLSAKFSPPGICAPLL